MLAGQVAGLCLLISALAAAAPVIHAMGPVADHRPAAPVSDMAAASVDLASGHPDLEVPVELPPSAVIDISAPGLAGLPAGPLGGNHADITQAGELNSSLLSQLGEGNSAVHRQVGVQNSADLVQVGVGNGLNLVQAGNNLSIRVHQRGMGTTLNVLQRN